MKTRWPIALILTILMALGASAVSPPPVPKVWRKVNAPTLGSAAKSLQVTVAPKVVVLPATNPPAWVQLAWDKSLGTNVITNYFVYYGSVSRTYTNTVSAGTNLTTSVSNLVRGVTYYFAVTAVDRARLESDFSSEVSWLVPNPPVPPMMKSLVVLSVQKRSEVGTWSDAGMSWSVNPVDTNQFYRLKIGGAP